MSQMLWMDEIMYFLSKCVITIDKSGYNCLVQYHNTLWVLYLDCTRGYLQFDMLVAIVSVRNNDTCLVRTRSADD